MKNNGHVVVVGGSKGLGNLIAKRFIEQEYVVTVISRTPLIDEPRVNYVYADLETIDSYVNEVVEKVLIHGGRIRYLIFCQRYRGSGDSWIGEIQVSLTATRLIIKSFSDFFCQEGDRAIGVVSSVYAEFIGGSQPDSYHVAKAGLNQLVRYNACEMGRKGIRINAVMPLTYLKPESSHYYLKNKRLMNLYQKLVPLGTLGKVEDSANLIEFLCSAKASFINGQSIYVDGGVSVVWPEELAKSFAGL